MLSDMKLKSLKPAEKPYKVADRDGMYVTVLKSGAISFRYDYRLNGRRETLVIGQYGPDGISLAEARELLMEARKKVAAGVSPASEKQRIKRKMQEEKRISELCEDWLAIYEMADSTRDMRESIIRRDLLPDYGRRLPHEFTEEDLRALCDKIVQRGAPATAVHMREIVMNIYSWAIARGAKYANPASGIKPSSIATFKPKDRALTPDEIGLFFRLLDRVATLPTIRLAIKLTLLTMVRKGELLLATWSEIDFTAATWTIPKDRMKLRRPHVVYLPQQALDILVALKTCAGGSNYILPSRYDADKPMSNATLNRVIDAAVAIAKKEDLPLDDFCVHDLRRTASTLLHEAGYNTDWIEKCLAHEQRGVRAVYNKAEYAEQRREMLQDWANMVDGWIAGAKVVPIGRAA
ncbi:tyrosine-type recombinase/integrase [Propionivibrio limicola]|uniref:tyrosine-type recombinase/integrase n=1 Tax=Propionivibrio limicola TaxID=167645 RepID=UPI0012923B49|nr:site-specific integrase [Propionivibrio limicola]